MPQDGPGRPTKLTDAFLDAAKSVLDSGDDVIICTDEEPLILINEKLPEADQITQRTFEAWKSVAQDSEELDVNFVEFLRVIKRRSFEKRTRSTRSSVLMRKPGHAGPGSSNASSTSGTSSERLSRA